MVVADINVVCVHQKHKMRATISNAQIDCYYSEHFSKDFMYDDKYLMLQRTEGIWYQIYPQARNRGDYDQEFMDLYIVNNQYKVVFCQKDFKVQLLVFLIELYYDSQIEALYFFVDLQGYAENHVQVSWENFLEMIREEKIYFNTVYKICKLVR